MRVLQNGQVVAELTAVEKKNDRLTAIWEGAPPSFRPHEQVEPLVLESDDGLARNDAWLLDVQESVGGPLLVEMGPERAAPAWRRSTPPSGRYAKRTRDVLVVDDDPDTVKLVVEALQEDGFHVRQAAGGREALLRAAETPPDVAIVDLIMPEIGGEDVCAALRRDPRFQGTRVLVLSGAEDTRRVAASCDADSALTKPFTTELLVREVRRLVEP